VDARTIVVMGGDQTGQELLEAALRVLQPDVVGIELALPQFDLSLASRRATRNAVVHEAAKAVVEHGLGLKAATITPEGMDDVGSPNRILREGIGGKVIVRTGRRIP
jgi:isocitrate dehydrogenase